MAEQDESSSTAGYSRRRILQAGAVGLAGAAVPALGSAAAGAATRTRALSGSRPAAATPIKHIIVCCQENHSFDHYFGTYAKLPAGYGIPNNYTQPDGNGGTVRPYHFTDLTSDGGDPDHSWDAIHSEWNNGKMNGFYTTNGSVAMGYYKARLDLPYYYSLFPKYTLCANYFCGVLSETYPNRLVLYSGTSGGNTSNDINNGSLNYPCILDLLSEHKISFKNYNFHCPDNYSILALFEKWQNGGPNNELNQSQSRFFGKGGEVRASPSREHQVDGNCRAHLVPSLHQPRDVLARLACPNKQEIWLPARLCGHQRRPEEICGGRERHRHHPIRRKPEPFDGGVADGLGGSDHHGRQAHS